MNPPPATRPSGRRWRAVAAFLLGAAAAVVLHYLIYRLSLPSAPFIYVAF
ncbi:hypothetical protein [Opitutus sp. ER46]|nr:hypothetical protein [Opitutus sp. ER46]